MKNIAICGNPNSGKTTIYNYLTGKNERVGNWSGVTVDAKIADVKTKFLPRNMKVKLIDLPGTYSMESYTKDESIAIEYIKSHSINGILNVIDMTQLERSLVFTLQLAQLNIPMVVALNKKDVAKKKRIEIEIEKLEELLNHEVILMQASKQKGIKEGLNKLLERIGKSHE